MSPFRNCGTNVSKPALSSAVSILLRCWLPAAFATIVTLSVTACHTSTKKLDEAIIYNGPKFKLKLVRYHENLPLHYTGEVFRVQCSSDKTANSPGHNMQDPGWVTLGNGSAIGSKSAVELAARESSNYRVVSDDILVWTGNGLNVSFDACGVFRGWYPSSLPETLINPVEKPDYCAPKGKVDCRNYDFMDDRRPIFEDIRVTEKGSISFIVLSRAFKNDQRFLVRSDDYGRSWSFLHEQVK
ncbi:MAG: hypothetical protein HZB62_04265 [Nitrospirae bacterium]|nr:hypothetical protein [Nitrospirota bacterium]